MTKALLDDHLLRDVLGNEIAPGLRRILRTHEPATTNLYLLRLCRSVVAAPGGQLTGQWPPERRAALPSPCLSCPRTSRSYPCGVSLSPWLNWRSPIGCPTSGPRR